MSKLLSTFLTIFILMGMLGIHSSSVFAQGGLTDYVESCPIDSISEDCNPPTLQTIEFIIVRILYIAWAFGGLLWFGYFVLIASIYLRGEIQKIEEAKKRFGIWAVGILIYYLAYVFIGQIMGVLIGGSSSCYGEFDGTPGFRFFFADVCT